MGKFKAVIEVEIANEKKAYLQKKDKLFNDLTKAIEALWKFKEPNTKFELDFDELDTMEGRERLEYKMEPLGIRHLNITKALADIQSDVILQKALMHTQQCIVRVYMIEGYDLASRDIGSDSDPYLVISVGDQVFNERDNYQLD